MTPATTHPEPSADDRRTRVFIVDDHDLVRQGLRTLLEAQPDFDVVGEAGSLTDALTRLPLARPDVAIVDLQLPDGSGSDVCRYLSTHQPAAACLVLSSFAHDGAVNEAVRAGAAGYVTKQIDNRELLDSIRRVAAGELLVDARSHATTQQRATSSVDDDERLAALTNQERRLLALLADGLTNREIGERLHISDKTVKNYVSSLLVKLGVTRRAAAAAYYERVVARRDIAMDDDDLRRGAIRY